MVSAFSERRTCSGSTPRAARSAWPRRAAIRAAAGEKPRILAAAGAGIPKWGIASVHIAARALGAGSWRERPTSFAGVVPHIAAILSTRRPMAAAALAGGQGGGGAGGG